MHRTALRTPGPPRLERLTTGHSVWLVTCHADVRQVLTDPRIGRSSLLAPDAPPLPEVAIAREDPQALIHLDGAEHRRLRQTAQRSFTPRAIARWRPWIASVVEELLDEMARRRPPVDLIAGYARPLPALVISRLMGLEGQDHAEMYRWSGMAFSYGTSTPEEARDALVAFHSFLARLFATRRRHPGDDLISGLIAAADESPDVSESQLVSLARTLVVAGLETTQSALGNGLLYLLDEAPEAWQRLAEQDEDKAEPLVENLLRFVPRADVVEGAGLQRRATAEVEIGGVTVAAGDVLVADVMAAGTDPEVYPPDLRASTDGLFSPLPAPSLAFGAGPHHCMGAWTARMTMQLALHRLAHRWPGLSLAGPVEEIEWRRGGLTRSPLRLEVTW
ncbi:cytochrome P450 [Streptomyces sp. NPDC006197]|uniref:cytochrome P450 n=1 Tax=Streptomyces sp. NPDC006197 TaxID=3156685 RepID=UPI0033A20D11